MSHIGKEAMTLVLQAFKERDLEKWAEALGIGMGKNKKETIERLVNSGDDRVIIKGKLDYSRINHDSNSHDLLV